MGLVRPPATNRTGGHVSLRLREAEVLLLLPDAELLQLAVGGIAITVVIHLLILVCVRQVQAIVVVCRAFLDNAAPVEYYRCLVLVQDDNHDPRRVASISPSSKDKGRYVDIQVSDRYVA